MKIELGQECDYEREAECCKKMRDLLRLFPEFYVPNVIEELSTKQVFTTELISGLTIDQVLNSLSIMLKYIGLLEKYACALLLLRPHSLVHKYVYP